MALVGAWAASGSADVMGHSGLHPEKRAAGDESDDGRKAGPTTAQPLPLEPKPSWPLTLGRRVARRGHTCCLSSILGMFIASLSVQSGFHLEFELLHF